ncbi:MAG: 50S ribosomal protein L24 [Actinobacteria bacterium]|nr:50S ribosomal protein L24 [Actinomycetota bacterium]
MKIKKGDRVRVLTGKDRGKEGNVLLALPGDGKVIVEGVNIVHKHRKPRGLNQPGGIQTQEMPLDVSNVGLLCDACGRPRRAGYRFEPDGTKVRVCSKCGGDL